MTHVAFLEKLQLIVICKLGHMPALSVSTIPCNQKISNVHKLKHLQVLDISKMHALLFSPLHVVGPKGHESHICANP